MLDQNSSAGSNHGGCSASSLHPVGVFRTVRVCQGSAFCYCNKGKKHAYGWIRVISSDAEPAY